MLGATIESDRLILRPLQSADAEAIADGLGRWDVTQWLALPPWPYHLEHAVEFLSAKPRGSVYAITLKDEGAAAALRGVISITEENSLGYWLHPSCKGRGLTREAAQAVVAGHFAASDQDLTATVQVENLASQRILHWLGFRETGRAPKFSTIRRHETTIAELRLTAADWAASPAALALRGPAQTSLSSLAQREAAPPPTAEPFEGN